MSNPTDRSEEVNPNNLKKGDTIYIEQAWEDETGCYHDEYATITWIANDGALKVKVFGHPKYKNVQLSAWINQGPCYAKDYNPEKNLA